MPSKIVLIESDWNLKLPEFIRYDQIGSGINRIRLEFKVKSSFLLASLIVVLIESDWNLKDCRKRSDRFEIRY